MKGFTLIELLAVIIILAIVALIATPIILNVIEDSRNSANMSQAEILYSGAQTLYASSILNDSLSDKFDGIEELYSLLETTNKKPEYGTLKIDSSGKIMFATYIDGKCYSSVEGESGLKVEEMENPLDCAPKSQYKDLILNGNDPVVNAGLIPVTISNDGTVTVADTTLEWYNYNSKLWANAISLNVGVSNPNVGDVLTDSQIQGYYVWIPRYEYKIFDVDTSSDQGEEQEIEIKFVSNTTAKKTEVILGEFYTHPAFTFGDDELSGLWVGKFEVSGTVDNMKVLPNATSLSDVTISNFFYGMAKIDGVDFNGNVVSQYTQLKNIGAHTIKNMEWGATAYLSHSKYGINGKVRLNNYNNNNLYKTGCGALYDNKNVTMICELKYGNEESYPQSTTGNISGIFDMSGGAYDYVMAFQVNQQSQSSGFNFEFFDGSNINYYDQYSYGDMTDSYERGVFGDATREVTGWYDNNKLFVSLAGSYNYDWFIRGGRPSFPTENGLFAFNRSAGGEGLIYGSRVVLVNTN